MSILAHGPQGIEWTANPEEQEAEDRSAEDQDANQAIHELPHSPVVDDAEKEEADGYLHKHQGDPCLYPV